MLWCRRPGQRRPSCGVWITAPTSQQVQVSVKAATCRRCLQMAREGLGMPMVTRLEEAALGTKQGRSAVVYKTSNPLNIALYFTRIHFPSTANDSPDVFFHLSVRVVVTRTSSPSLLPNPNDQSLTTLRDTKTIPHDAPTTDSAPTSQLPSYIYPLARDSPAFPCSIVPPFPP